MKAKIHSDMVSYLKNKEKVSLAAVRMLIGAIEKREKEVRRELTSDEIVSMVTKEIKGYKETASYYKETDDKYNELMVQIDTISQYLPKQLTADEVIQLIKDNMSENKNEVMKAVMPLIKGKFDSKEAIKLINELMN